MLNAPPSRRKRRGPYRKARLSKAPLPSHRGSAAYRGLQEHDTLPQPSPSVAQGQSSHGLNERRDLAPAGNRLDGVAACLKAFLLPLGAPGDRPPCTRQRPFGIAGDWHRLPLLVRARISG
jgi:hypothetical protein